ncbi:MAG TPA: ABC transporter permease [Desulfobacteraceae bacterium]|nr:ABC transporter permease [Desulfobacteraceae bacterium]HPJ68636.1 ABC transporter permease [Desulfobacteraceae bacterium]HPQ27543.1 ABC transporter permease [Desulfobacteraceae bacterium]
MISIGMLKDVWAFRGMMWSSVKREFQSRWTGTQFGPFWLIAQPLATIIIFTVVFANLMRPGMPAHDSKFAYSIYLCSGVLTYGLFSEMLGRSVNIFVEHANLLKKINFPKLCLPIIIIVSSILNFAIIISLFILFLIITSSFPGWVILTLLPVVAIQLLFTIGLGMLLATINVFYRDVQQMVQVVLQFWFWLTPIVYVASTLPDTAQKILGLNPLWPLIQAYQGIFLEHQVPHWTGLIYPLILAVVSVFLGIFAFFKLQGEIVDEL